MAKFEYHPELEPEKPARTKQGHGRCEVYGCPRDGHVHTGVWNCRYHQGKSGSSLARITLALRNHEREFNWYEHLLNATVVDFAMGDIARDAPSGLYVLPNETFRDYKLRVTNHIENLFVAKSRIAEEVAL